MTRYLTATQHGQSLSRVAGAYPLAVSAQTLPVSLSIPVDTKHVNFPTNFQAPESANQPTMGAWNLSGKREPQAVIT